MVNAAFVSAIEVLSNSSGLGKKRPSIRVLDFLSKRGRKSTREPDTKSCRWKHSKRLRWWMRAGLTPTSLEVRGLAIATTYFWRANATNDGGTSDWSTIWRFTTEQVTSVGRGHEIPDRFSLGQNYPNSFNPSMHIVFEMPRAEYVTLKIYSVLGEEMATVVSGRLPAGRHIVTFDARGLASWVYLYGLQTRSFVQTRKMLLMRWGQM